MDFKDYQTFANSTRTSQGHIPPHVYATLGLVGEAGEVAEKVKKLYRDRDGEITDAERTEIKKELGDVLWYISQVAHDLGFSIDDVAVANKEKLQSRKDRNMVHGDGDNR